MEIKTPNKVFPIPKPGEFITKQFFGEDLEVFFPGQAHSPDNLSFYIPSRNILFAGCMVKDIKSVNLGNLADGYPKKYEDSLKRLFRRYGSIADLLVIPGHGITGGKELIEHSISLSEDLKY